MNDNNKPYNVYRVEGAKPPRKWRRIVLTVVLCVLAVVIVGAGGAYIWLNVVLNRSRETDRSIVSFLNQTTTTARGTTETSPEAPGSMDIIVFGSDHREEGEEWGRSDSIMLVHVDSTNNFVSVLSLPRDLRVEIPGYGTEKLNAAYSYGGPLLAAQTIQELTNIDLDHYVNIDFDAFRGVTTQLGGVWIDVDRRYYHQAQLDQADPWENIDIQAGYQRLMGEDALDFVRFRHDGNYDFGRMERQQLFLREAQRQLMSLGTTLKLPGLVSMVASNVKTDLSTNQILSLAWFALHLDGSRIKSVKLEGDDQTINDVSYVILNEDQLRDCVQEFLTAPKDQPASSTAGGSPTSSSSAATSGTSGNSEFPLSGVQVDVLNGSGRTGQAGAAAALLREKGADVLTIGNAATSGNGTVISYPAGQKQAAEGIAAVLEAGSSVEDDTLSHLKVVLGPDFSADVNENAIPGASGIIYEDEYFALQSQVSFQMMGPGYLPPGYNYKDRRVYEMDAGGSRTYPAVKTLYQLDDQDQYLGIMQTTFTEAPIAAAGETVTEKNVTFTIVGISGKTDRVWWKKDGVLYWVSNTLMHRLSREELLKVATGMVDVKE